MSDQTYEIQRWDAVLFGNSTTPSPIIYVKPDKTLLDFSEANNGVLLVKINNSDSIYDGKDIPAVFKKSSEVPNCRPNFFEKTGLYVFVLDSYWYGYPDNLGTCEIYGLKGGEPAIELRNISLDAPVKSLTSRWKKNNNSDGMSSSSIKVVTASIFVFFLLLIFLRK